jgi:excisionase family DNA binding protein
MPSTATAELLTVNEAAAKLRLTPDTVYRLIQRGRLRAFRVGESGPLRIEPEAIDELLQPTSSARASTDGFLGGSP